MGERFTTTHHCVGNEFVAPTPGAELVSVSFMPRRVPVGRYDRPEVIRISDTAYCVWRLPKETEDGD